MTEEVIPKIIFDQSHELNIEVVHFAQLNDRLTFSRNHDPFAPHKIKFYLILVLTENTYTHFVDFEQYTLEKGSALFVAKNQVHHFTKELLNAAGFAIIFNSLFVDKPFFLADNLKINRLFNYHIETPIIHQSEMGEDNLIDAANNLSLEFNRSSTFRKSEMLRSLLFILLLKAERAKDSHTIIEVKSNWFELFSKFKNALETEYINTRNSREYAAKLLVSYKFLNDVVKHLTGKTVKAFIDDFVVTEIKRNLVSTSLSIKEISFKTGFDEPANMIKFFKRHTNTTPFKFRQQSE